MGVDVGSATVGVAVAIHVGDERMVGVDNISVGVSVVPEEEGVIAGAGVLVKTSWLGFLGLGFCDRSK